MDTSAPPKKSRQLFVFLFAADLVVLFIYLLLLPTNLLIVANTRLRLLGALAVSVLAYLGVDKLLRKRFVDIATIFDSYSFRASLLFVSVIMWAAVMPVWSYRFVFTPNQITPPTIEIGGKIRYPVSMEEKTKDGDSIYELDGLLLRNYEYKFAGLPASRFLPAISILKGTFLGRAVRLQLPCTVTLPLITGAKVTYRGFAWQAPQEYGPLPGDGRIFLMPGHYDFVRIETGQEEGSGAVEVTCPETELQISMQVKGGKP